VVKWAFVLYESLCLVGQWMLEIATFHIPNRWGNLKTSAFQWNIHSYRAYYLWRYKQYLDNILSRKYEACNWAVCLDVGGERKSWSSPLGVVIFDTVLESRSKRTQTLDTCVDPDSCQGSKFQPPILTIFNGIILTSNNLNVLLSEFILTKISNKFFFQVAAKCLCEPSKLP